MSTPVVELGRRAKFASQRLALASTAEKDAALLAAADLLVERAAELLAANHRDIAEAEAAGMDATPLDRLRLTDTRLAGMTSALRQVAALADPVGDVIGGWKRPNGLRIEQVRVPLGVVAVIYENRPNVTSDAAAICVKSGNAAVLRGSSTAQRTNAAIAEVVRDGLAKAGLPRDAVVLVDDPSHDAAIELMQLDDYIDCLVPRGGPELLAGIREHATVPVVPDLDGAIAHINRYSSGHTEAIVTRDLDAARRFTQEIDSGTVVVNASTRFTDGEEFGFGAEIGISTQKLHARGPMGPRALTTYKYVVWGDGQVRR